MLSKVYTKENSLFKWKEMLSPEKQSYQIHYACPMARPFHHIHVNINMFLESSKRGTNKQRTSQKTDGSPTHKEETRETKLLNPRHLNVP
jgi:hypothetical protein